MKSHRFIGDFDFKKSFAEISEKEFVNQIRNVLKLRKGEKIILADGKLKEAPAEIKNIKKNSVELEILEIAENKNESSVCGILYCSILKKQNFELAAQKATEVGIKEIFPVISNRTVKTSVNLERLKKIIKEAGEQSERGVLPKLNGILSFEESLKKAGENDLNLFFDKKGVFFGELAEQKEILKFKNKTDKNAIFKIGVFIGPEGGWTEEEIKASQEKNFKIVSLGKLNFRAETAAVIASYLVSQEIL